jgi:hypothetical protein
MKEIKFFRLCIGAATGIVALFCGMLSLLVVPAPNSWSATEISGTLISISKIDPDFGDIGIVLDRGRNCYIYSLLGMMNYCSAKFREARLPHKQFGQI